METEYFMSYFSSAICSDMNIIRRAAAPFQPTRKAFSTNSECISVCWNSQESEKRMLQKPPQVSVGENIIKAPIQFSGHWWRHLKTHRAQERKPRGGEGQTSSLLAQLLCQVSKSHQITAQKYQVTVFGRGAEGQGELLWVTVMDTYGIWGQRGQAREIQVRDIHSDKKIQWKG